MTSDVLTLLADAVRELVEPHTHHEATFRHDGEKWIRSRHSIAVPALVEQLRAAVTPSSSADAGKSSFTSRPSARVDAIDTLLRIEQAADDWLVRTCNQPTRDTLEGNLRALVGCAPHLDEQLRWDLTREARRWATWARVTTGWEVPPFRPNNTCPLCARRGGLRVRVGDGISSYDSSATCVECGETWDSDTIGILAAHIRSENADEQDDVA